MYGEWRRHTLKRRDPLHHLYFGYGDTTAACGMILHPVMAQRAPVSMCSGHDPLSLVLHLKEDEICPLCVVAVGQKVLAETTGPGVE